MDTNTPSPRNTNAFFLQAGLAFAVALLTMMGGVFYLPVDGWIRAFLGIGTLFLTTSCFTLAKCVRDAQEASYAFSRLDQARIERILSERDPWNNIGDAR